ncbi:hypothetical protein Patl1_10982 [Pistacia atlantica]|uniref:Uncharacterized protein n=1 Tax=Pistacia atlantica TaxID=434234 RepID=A0ACC1A9Y3_9ROSI|nr:hypothetical protein Patl1_10982 [Pistacia atlantica]
MSGPAHGEKDCLCCGWHWICRIFAHQAFASEGIFYDQKKISHLISLQELGELKIFGADLTDEGSFDVPIAGSDIVFHVATPVNFASEDPENDMIKPAIQGVVNVLKACAKSKTVKRVVLTSSTSAVTINGQNGTGLVMDEKNWTDVEFLSSAKPPTWGHPASKTLAEKHAWKFAQENNIDLITVIPPLIAGPSLTPDIPSSTGLAMCLITGNEFLAKRFEGFANAVRIPVFLNLPSSFTKDTLRYKVPTDFGDFPSKAKLVISSEKLISEGFSFKFGIEEIYDQTLEYFKSKGVLN